MVLVVGKGEIDNHVYAYNVYPIVQVFPTEMTISLRRKKGRVKGGLYPAAFAAPVIFNPLPAIQFCSKDRWVEIVS